jgi:bifunctional UDP-N-acetylglucosamine pyrophosphorylase/glucosamine-1-phosphate N-acetyltransferase
MADRPFTTIVLAAGEGKRMRSTLPKVLHLVAGRSLLGHVLTAAGEAGAGTRIVVVGPDHEAVVTAARVFAPDVAAHVQAERRGTAHAVLAARPALEAAQGDVVVAFGDNPLVTAESFRRLRAPLSDGAAVVVGAFEAADPTGYGRLILADGRPVAIREHRDASAAERAITLCNGGLMALDAAHALALLDAVGSDNAQGEFYLTDVVALAAARGLRTAVVTIDETEFLGINDRVQLAAAEAAMQARLRRAAMVGGATLTAPETVFLSADTRLSSDVWIGPNVVIGPGVTIESGVEIHAFSHLTECHVAAGARIGPFARIRPKSRIGEGVHIGNFVEVNRSTLEARVEANHLAYLGDSTVGEGTNIGAGTITCNFDGADKHATRIGRDVFVGTNATLVAPLTIGDEVLIAAGSTVTDDVPAGALVFGRARQDTKAERGAERIRANKARRAARKAKG